MDALLYRTRRSTAAIGLPTALLLLPAATEAAPPSASVSKSEAASLCAVQDTTTCLLSILARMPRAWQIKWDLAFLAHPDLLKSAGLAEAVVPQSISSDVNVQWQTQFGELNARVRLGDCRGDDPDRLLASVDAETSPESRIRFYRGLLRQAQWPGFFAAWSGPTLPISERLARAALLRWERDQSTVPSRPTMGDSALTDASEPQLDMARAYMTLGDQVAADRVVRIDPQPGTAGEVKRLAVTGRIDQAAELLAQALTEAAGWYRERETTVVCDSQHCWGEELGTEPHGRTPADTWPALSDAVTFLLREAVAQHRPDLAAQTAAALSALNQLGSRHLRVVATYGDRDLLLKTLGPLEQRMLAGAKTGMDAEVFKQLYLAGEHNRAHAVLEALLPLARRHDGNNKEEDVGLRLGLAEMLLWEHRFQEADELYGQPVWPQKKVLADLESGRGLGDTKGYLATAPTPQIRRQAYQECRSEMIGRHRIADAYACHQLQWSEVAGDVGFEDLEDLRAWDLAERAAQQGDLALAHRIVGDIIERWRVRKPAAERTAVRSAARKGLAEAGRADSVVSDEVPPSIQDAMRTIVQFAAQHRQPEIVCSNKPSYGDRSPPPGEFRWP